MTLNLQTVMRMRGINYLKIVMLRIWLLRLSKWFNILQILILKLDYRFECIYLNVHACAPS